MLIDRTPVIPAGWPQLQEKLGVAVSDELLFLALSHPSSVGEGVERTLKSNQRLEFLGDTILGAVVASHLYRAFPHSPEGELTQRKASIVQKTTLANVARRLDLGRYLVLGRGEHNAGGAKRDTILSDALEAVLGAIYLEHGMDAVRAFIEKWFEPELTGAAHSVNAKNRLQEWTQANGLGTPIYATEAGPGTVHTRRYYARVLLLGEARGRGEGRTKKEAETKAAQNALELLTAPQNEENAAPETAIADKTTDEISSASEN